MNRDLVKWKPFNAVVPGSYMVNKVLKDKYKINMPVLSEDQQLEIQEKIYNSFQNQELIKIKYFRDGNVFIREGKVTNINISKHKLIINDRFFVFFSQIIEIY